MGDTMATFDYPASAATASRLLAKFGQDVTLSKVVPGVYDPVTGEHGPGEDLARAALAAILPYSDGDKFAAGGMIQEGDRRFIMEAGGEWPPDISTTLTDVSGVAWNVESVEPFDPAGVPTHYKGRLNR